MTVVDASIVVDLLAGESPAAVLMRLPAEPWSVPHLVDAETVHALRRFEQMGRLTAAQAGAAIEELGNLDLFRYSAESLRTRIWELRGSLTAYDATYVALAEHLEEPLLTKDARLAAAPGVRAEVEVIR